MISRLFPRCTKVKAVPASREEYALLCSEPKVILDSIDGGIWIIDAAGKTWLPLLKGTKQQGFKG